ncbi:hypothetical protein EVAR_93980_1 [Eumeta japonica]|uniref:Uncharacterized protein n=1 Tax=Eumeta variegata TaxID=151549 RepID=A0A4C1TPB3_EUMVA|nr:hypothetical protein EVAR_93980_1 [Eumeta japonica]
MPSLTQIKKVTRRHASSLQDDGTTQMHDYTRSLTCQVRKPRARRPPNWLLENDLVPSDVGKCYLLMREGNHRAAAIDLERLVVVEGWVQYVYYTERITEFRTFRILKEFNLTISEQNLQRRVSDFRIQSLVPTNEKKAKFATN